MKRGTEKRRRNNVLAARFNDQEAAAIREIAASRGLTVGSLIYHATLNAPPPKRALPRPRVDTVALVRFTGGLASLTDALRKADDGRPISLLNQVAAYLHSGRPVERLLGLLEEALQLAMERERLIAAATRDLLEVRLPALQALGQEPARREVIELDDPVE